MPFGHNTGAGKDRSQKLLRREWLSALGVGAAAGVAGCGDLTDDDDDDDDTYTAVQSASFETLNPVYNTEAGAGTAIGYALDQGYTFLPEEDDFEYFPLLYDMSTDQGQTWVFDVREGLEFSDPYGEVTAETFVYYIEEIHQSDWASSASDENWVQDEELINVEVNSEYEFQAELPEGDILWPETFDPLLYPIPQELLEPYVDEEDQDGLQEDQELVELQFTGNLGAYSLDEWVRGSGTRYSRNDDYYLSELATELDDIPDRFDGAPFFEDGAEIDIIEEESSRIAALQTGSADSVSLPPRRIDEFRVDEDVAVKEIPQPYNSIVGYNMRDNGWTHSDNPDDNLFRIKEFRQGIACAIDKEEIVDLLYQGTAEEHFTWQPGWSEWYPDDRDFPEFGTGDLLGEDVARDYVEDALEQHEFDYTYDEDDNLVGPDGNQVTLDIYHSVGQETEREEAEFIADALDENLGIDVIVESIDGVNFVENYWTVPDFPDEEVEDEELGRAWAEGPNNPGPRSVTANENWDMSLVLGLNTYPRQPLANEAFFDGPDADYNPVGYYPEFDAEGIFQDMREADTRDELADAVGDLFVNLAEEQPYGMLVFPDDTMGYNPDLEGPIEDFSNGWDSPAWRVE